MTELNERQAQQRASRDRHMKAVEDSLQRASDLVESSQREIRRSRDLMNAQKADNARQDKEEDDRRL